MMHIYDKKLNGQVHRCEVCGISGILVQHHVGGKRYDDRAIWVHDLCHKKIHNPTAFDLPGDWAYKNNYLLRRSNNMIKAKKDRKCLHTKSYYDARLGYLKCNYCGDRIDTLKFGVKKAKKENSEKQAATKIGYESQDPRIKQAENLKKELRGIKLNIKKFAHDKQKYEYWNNEAARVKHEMKQLQSTYEE